MATLEQRPQVLCVSTKLDPHVDIIADKLNKRGIPFVRFNTEDFPLRVTTTISFDCKNQNQILDFPLNRRIVGDDILAVWYRRPAQFQFPNSFTPAIQVFADQESRSTITGLWEILDCTWINHPENNRRAELKIKQLKVASKVGLNIPKTLITNDPTEAEKFFRKTNRTGVIIKRLGGGVVLDGKDNSAIYTSIVTQDHMNQVQKIRYVPVLFQEHIQKDLELRITVVGEEIFACEIHSQESAKAQIDWRRDTLNLKHKIHELPQEIKDKLLSFMKNLDLNFGAIDMIITPDGKYVFLEINPNGQWGWIEDLTGLPISDSIITLLTDRSKH